MSDKTAVLIITLLLLSLVIMVGATNWGMTSRLDDLEAYAVRIDENLTHEANYLKATVTALTEKEVVK